MKFDFEQLSFEAFFEITRIFGSVESEIECNLQFQYNIIFQPYQSFESHSSFGGGEEKIDIHDPAFFVQNPILNNFHLKLFLK